MCNGITKSGKPCSRKADWCAQHISQKPEEIVAAPVVEQIVAAPVVEEIVAAPVVEEIVAAPVAEEIAVIDDAELLEIFSLVIYPQLTMITAPGDINRNTVSPRLNTKRKSVATLSPETIYRMLLLFKKRRFELEDVEFEPEEDDDPILMELESFSEALANFEYYGEPLGIVINADARALINQAHAALNEYKAKSVVAKPRKIAEAIKAYGLGQFYKSNENEFSAETRINFVKTTRDAKSMYFAFDTSVHATRVYEKLSAEFLNTTFELKLAKPKRKVSIGSDSDVGESVIEEKKEEPELIQDEKDFVSENIVSPMSPNTAIATSPQPELPIVEETNPAPIKKIFSERACLQIHRGNEYQYWIDHCALSKAEVSFKLLQPNGEYCFDIKGCHVLQVYKYEGARVISRPFVWFWNPVDMFAFIKYFHSDSANNDSQFECHELFIGRDPTVKVFFDIEKVIPTEFYNGLKSDCGKTDAGVGEQICRDVMTGLKSTLEEFDLKFDSYESDIDYAIVSRTRAVDDDNTKVSYHLITNIAMRVSECKAIVKALKSEHLGTGLTMSDEYRELLCSSTTIDINPYRKNGTLSLPGGRKNGHQLTIIREFKSTMDLHLVETYACHRYHEFSDELLIQAGQSSREVFEESSSEFVKKALAKLTEERVPAYDPKAMDLWANSPRGNYLFVKRTAPSHCPECDRTHDNADTLLLIFNESKEIALWKCSHNEDMKAKRWFGKSGQKEYEIDATTDDDIEAFAKTLKSRAEKAEETEKAKEVEKKKEDDDRMSNQEAMRELPTWDITIDKDVIPPIHDIHDPCSYVDYLTLSEGPISGKDAMKYIYNNFALILDGGNSFFISKNFSYRPNGNRETCEISYKYLKYKSIHNTPGELHVKLTNPKTKKDEIHIFPIWKLLMRWQSHIAYSEIRFSPYGARIGYDWSNKRVFNTFTGFVNHFDPDFVVDESKFERFFAHIREAWCDDNIELFEFTVKLLAYMVQFPHLKTAVAMIVMGPEGLGKNFVMELWRDHVIGDAYFVETPRIEAITGKFNTQLENNLMVVLNEAAKVNRSIDSNKDQEVVKDLITEKRRRYERKNHDAYMGDCYNNVVMFSNNDCVVRASTEMRRFVFYKGSGRFIGKEMEHFAPIEKDFVENDAGTHLYHYLMNIDLAGFHPQRSAPTTKTKEELKLTAIEKPIQWLIATLNEETQHTFVNTKERETYGEKKFYRTDTIIAQYKAWLVSCGENPDTTLKKFSKALNKCFGDSTRKRMGGVKVRGYELSINEMKQLVAKTTRHNDLFCDDDE